jgi:hypothetical protein
MVGLSNRIKEFIMDETNEKMKQSVQKYLLLMKIINIMENRLVRTETIYLVINLFIFFIAIICLNLVKFFSSSYFYLSFHYLLYWLTIGMILCLFWTAVAMRLQLKLKLHYFQARYLERKMDVAGESFYSDEDIFFDHEIRKIESPDKKEVVLYPTEGLSQMDGFLGAAKPRYLTWIQPSIFFILYLLIFIDTLVEIISALPHP